jgi:ssDNA-binding replication factor A large subunit
MNMVSLTDSSGGEELSPKLTSVADLTPFTKSVAILLKVVSTSQTRQVSSNKTGRRLLVQDAVAGDSTARINMTLWNEDTGSLQEGQTYLLTKGYVREYDECMYLLRSRDGEFKESERHIEDVNESVNMSKPFRGQKPQRRTPRTRTGRSFRGTPGREEKGYCSWKGF